MHESRGEYKEILKRSSQILKTTIVYAAVACRRRTAAASVIEVNFFVAMSQLFIGRLAKVSTETDQAIVEMRRNGGERRRPGRSVPAPV